MFAVEPHEVAFTQGSLKLGADVSVGLGNGLKRVFEYLQDELADRKVALKISDDTEHIISIGIDADVVPENEGYILNITEKGISIVAHDEQGAFWAVVTLLEVVDSSSKIAGSRIKLPCLTVHDWPDYSVRGFLLDVSRDKVPSMETLYRLVDRLAKYKINQFQLYFEHVFAYRKHKAVWKNASPFLPEEIQALDLYCKRKNIELVANQNSLAHMHRWIMHKGYKELAETPSTVSKKNLERENYEHEGNPGYSLCPTNPGTLELIEGLYKELLPNFTCHTINVGLDEPNDLVRGGEKSRALIRKKGISEVYFDYLQNIYKLVKSFGNDRVMQFWADFIITEDELIRQLPKDVVPLLWGYEDEFPFEMGRKFYENGIRWFVCPSTCSWSSIGGRADDAIKNLSQAALKGKENGAAGYLITEWGDNGHHHPLSVSQLGLYLGARFSWNTRSAKKFSSDSLPLLLDNHVFHDKNHKMGQISLKVGDVYKQVLKPNSTLTCCSALLRILVFNNDLPDREVLESLSKEGLQKAIETLSESKKHLQEAALDGWEGGLVLQEYHWVIDALSFAAKFGIVLLENPAIKSVNDLKKSDRKELLKELIPVLDLYKTTWALRNRKGGFEDSFRRLDHLRTLLK
ncbi:glycoside hydrolase family 20 zincin-like fold domain-containing protein [Estrella lausannensis]|uniref:glycoside hydrolase family 20 zincin-like fold domain-containing protein n=1 Tax=Estrella lausannensis TaxID=483423 RepID=UPI0013043DF7|nr:glycoside hydrolase family 20 zincin-like fold domain-containing protein [Estrella lausannensis]